MSGRALVVLYLIFNLMVTLAFVFVEADDQFAVDALNRARHHRQTVETNHQLKEIKQRLKEFNKTLDEMIARRKRVSKRIQ